MSDSAFHRARPASREKEEEAKRRKSKRTTTTTTTTTTTETKTTTIKMTMRMLAVLMLVTLLLIASTCSTVRAMDAHGPRQGLVLNANTAESMEREASMSIGATTSTTAAAAANQAKYEDIRKTLKALAAEFGSLSALSTLPLEPQFFETIAAAFANFSQFPCQIGRSKNTLNKDNLFTVQEANAFILQVKAALREVADYQAGQEIVERIVQRIKTQLGQLVQKMTQLPTYQSLGSSDHREPTGSASRGTTSMEHEASKALETEPTTALDTSSTPTTTTTTTTTTTLASEAESKVVETTGGVEPTPTDAASVPTRQSALEYAQALVAKACEGKKCGQNFHEALANYVAALQKDENPMGLALLLAKETHRVQSLASAALTLTCTVEQAQKQIQYLINQMIPHDILELCDEKAKVKALRAFIKALLSKVSSSNDSGAKEEGRLPSQVEHEALVAKKTAEISALKLEADQLREQLNNYPKPTSLLWNECVSSEPQAAKAAAAVVSADDLEPMPAQRGSEVLMQDRSSIAEEVRVTAMPAVSYSATDDVQFVPTDLSGFSESTQASLGPSSRMLDHRLGANVAAVHGSSSSPHVVEQQQGQSASPQGGLGTMRPVPYASQRLASSLSAAPEYVPLANMYGRGMSQQQMGPSPPSNLQSMSPARMEYSPYIPSQLYTMGPYGSPLPVWAPTFPGMEEMGPPSQHPHGGPMYPQ